MATADLPWIASENDDNGSLFTGANQLTVGDLVEIEGEGRYRSVTYVMGSAQNGWRACFGRLNGVRQGAVPVGAVRWRVVQSGNGQIAPAPPPPVATAAIARPEAPVDVAAKEIHPHARLISTKLILEILLAVVGVVGGIIALWRALR